MITRSSSMILSLVSALLVAGCYSYVPTRLESVPVGAVVRTFVSTQAALSLDQQIELGQGPVSGRLLERTENRILLLVRGPSARGPRYSSSGALYQRVDVAVPDVLRVDLRQMHKVRTGGLIAALVGAVAVAIITAVGESEPGSPPSGPSPVE